MYMDDIELFTKNKKGVETLMQAIKIYIQDINRLQHFKKKYNPSNVK